MGDSTCLLQQQPFCYASGISNEANESNLIHALGQSISFGRFGSETLAWEKWSSFSHNRYVEEAERYSRPGSVAEKKAFFEAHYKKLAAQKAAALLEQANNAVSNSVTDQEHVDTDEATIPTSDTVQNKEVQVESSSESQSNVADINRVEEECQPLVSNSMKVELQNQLQDVHTQKKESEKHSGKTKDEFLAPMNIKIPAAPPLKAFKYTETAKFNLAPLSSKKPALNSMEKKRSTINSSPISSVDRKRSTINSSPINSVDKKRSTTNSSPISSVDKRRSTVNSTPIRLVDKKGSTINSTPSRLVSKKGSTVNSTPISLGYKMRSTYNSTPISLADKMRSTVNSTPISLADQMRSTVNSTPISLGDKMRSTVDSTPISLADQMRSTVNSTPISLGDKMRSTVDSTPISLADKMRSTVNSTPMSTVDKKRSAVNFTPIRELNRLTASVMRKFDSARVGNASSKASKDSSTPLRTPTMASKNQSQKPPALTPLTEKRRAQTPVGSLASGTSSTAGPKWRLPSTESKLRSPIISSPFSLRTEERAARRKKNLEEKFKANEAQKVQLHTKLKEKAETEIRRLRQSFCFKARPLPDFYKERKELKNEIKECQLTHPDSPKQGKRPPGRLWCKSSATMKSNGTKNHHLETNCQSDNHYLTSNSKMIAQENASPNIQQGNQNEFTQLLEQGITRRCRKTWQKF